MRHFLFVDCNGVAELVNALRLRGDAVLRTRGVDDTLAELEFQSSDVETLVPSVDAEELNLAEVCALVAKARRADCQAAVLVVGPGKLTEATEQLLLETGADAVLRRPVNIDLLSAKADAVIRRLRGRRAGPIVAFHGFELDAAAQTVRRGADWVHLTSKEFELLALLVDRRGEVVTKQQVMHHLYGWGEPDEPQQKIMDVFMCKVRRKIAAVLGREPEWIKTVWGRGWMIEKEDKPVVLRRSALEHSEFNAT